LGLRLITTRPPGKDGRGKMVSGHDPLANLLGEKSGESSSKLDGQNENGKTGNEGSEGTNERAKRGKKGLELGIGSLDDGLDPRDGIIDIVSCGVEFINDGSVGKQRVQSLARLESILEG